MNHVMKSLAEVVEILPQTSERELWNKVLDVYRSENRSLVQPVEVKMEKLLKGSLKERDAAVEMLVPFADHYGIELRHVCSRIARMVVCHDSLAEDESRLIAAPFEAVGVDVVGILNNHK